MMSRNPIKGLVCVTALCGLMLGAMLCAQVSMAWVNRYDGPASGNDEARAMALDRDGNIYVTGRSAGIGTGMDVVTIKYDPYGKELWVRRYDGPAHGEDGGRALAIDAQGNVYVAGESLAPDTEMDFVTIKYSPQGDELWVRRYDGPDHLQDYAVAIAIDTTGRVYVTGPSNGINKFDFLTVAYDSDGNELWIDRFDGKAHDHDFPVAIAVDNDQNVFITGYTDAGPAYHDYLTISYTREGILRWDQTYNGPDNNEDYTRALVIDAEGNCYVTGESTGPSTNFDIATIKYDSSGRQVWLARYNHSGQRLEDNSPRTIAMDDEGYIYITGSSVDRGISDYVTVKYNPDGNEVWSRFYRGTGIGLSIATALALDAYGNVYITGRSIGDRSGLDYVTIKYNADGEEQWIERYNGPGNGEDSANAVALDNDYNVYVTGSSIGADSGMDFATIKYTQK
ncbi:MAG: SBBP repeat-containing protein [Acidobacteria bacterium]|nr:SBBP repeat-containing protein [Acidobacteriota bacterium]MBI3658771.1 SBBP repeat-containing protein [Acidobacteriota bacterium]